MGKINIKQLVKRFGKATVIKGTDLDINDGEFVVFVGPSGCGKSTILRMIAGLEEITSGTIEIDGVVVNNLPPVQRGISMVFQTYALYPHLTVYENIAFPLRVAKLSQDKVEERVQYAAKALQLEERLNHKPGELSGGQRQRVAIGRAIVREPKVFLFDEPLSNLDAALRADMRIELSELHDKLGNTMIYVTHDQIEAMTMADKIVVLRAGNIEQVGSPLELYHHPTNRFVASFIGSPNMNFFKATTLKSLDTGMSILLDGKDIVLPVTPRDVSIGHKVEVGIRPEDIHIGEGDISLDVTVDVIEKLGSSTLIYAHSPLSADRIRIVIPKTVDIKTGKNITIGFNKHDCHLFDTQEQAFQRQN